MKMSNKQNEHASLAGRPLCRLPESLDLAFSPGADQEVTKAMEHWVQRLEEEGADKLSVHRIDSGHQTVLPALVLQGEGTSEIVYHFVPEGPEEEAFRELLWHAAERKKALAGQPKARDARTDPQELFLFVANACPNCPRAVRIVHALGMEIPHVSAHLFEATLWPEFVEKNEIKSVPTLLIGDKLRFVGDLEKEKIASIVAEQDTRAMLQEQVRQYIRGGKAPEAGALIAEMDDPRFLLEDLRNATFQDRIGLLLALDEAMEVRPDCLEPLVTGLLSCLDSEDAALRGDLADLLGRIGHPEAIPTLEQLRGDPNPDVAEAAADAVETIRRHQH